MKKIIAAALAALTATVCAFAVSCGKKDSANNSSSGDTGDLTGVTYNERTGEIYADTKDGKTAIKISYTPGFGNMWAIQSARSFLLSDEGKDYYMILNSDSELTTSVSSKLESEMNLSDIYFPLASNWYSYAALGQLANLDDLYSMTIPGETKTVGEKIRGSWTTYGKATCSGENHYYVFPGNENITGIVYNKTMFDKYGWTIPETTDDLKALCEKIVQDTNGKIAPFVYPGTVPGGYWDFIGTNWWLQISGSDKLNEFMKFESADVFNPMKKDSPSEGKLEMLEIFEEIIVNNRSKYTLKGSASKNHLLAQVSFMQGQAAMIPNGNWIEKESLSNMTDEYRMMATPRPASVKADADGKYKTYNYTGQPDYMFIPAKAKNIDGAKKFLAWCCRDDVLAAYTSQTGTTRPFDYDVDSCEVTPFIESCFEIWKNSETWFEQSTSKLWTAGKVKKFQRSNPYGTLLANAGTITAIGWCQKEYEAVIGSWSEFVAAVS